MPADADPCEGCGAEPFEPCREGCCGFAGFFEELERRAADGLIGRALTVEASKLYARLHYAALLCEVQERP